MVQVAKDTVVSKSDVDSVLVELMVYGCYIQKICGEHYNSGIQFQAPSSRGCGIFIHSSTFTLASTEEKVQGSQTFAGRWRTDQGGACLWVVDLFPQLASLLCICVHRSKGLDRVVNVSIYSKDVPF